MFEHKSFRPPIHIRSNAKAEPRISRDRQGMLNGGFRQATFALSLEVPRDLPSGIFGVSRRNLVAEEVSK
jgi:hypothetical protein